MGDYARVSDAGPAATAAPAQVVGADLQVRLADQGRNVAPVPRGTPLGHAAHVGANVSQEAARASARARSPTSETRFEAYPPKTPLRVVALAPLRVGALARLRVEP